MSTSAALPFHIGLAGPTAAGKTAAALALAQAHDCEIISVDSALVYRGMDVGTAKPNAAELAAVPHHLINIRDPLQAYSAAEFVTDATALIQSISARGDLHPDLPSMRCVGYRQVWEVLDGQSPQAELRDKGIFATRQLAKRQITWLRSMPQRHVIACDAPGALAQVLQTVNHLLERSP